MMQVNVNSVIKGTKVAVLHMARRGGGVIVSTASMAGIYSTAL
jgi:15-hydroxyprostaglandin dehydrogenase (NAD)